MPIVFWASLRAVAERHERGRHDLQPPEAVVEPARVEPAGTTFSSTTMSRNPSAIPRIGGQHEREQDLVADAVDQMTALGRRLARSPRRAGRRSGAWLDELGMPRRQVMQVPGDRPDEGRGDDR